MNVGYIGIGIMGQPMARNLLEAGHSLYIHNRTLSKCDTLAAQGATVCQSPAEAAENSEVVFINVPDTQDVENVIFGPNGIYDAARAGLIVIDNSTISPGATREFAKRLAEKQVQYIDAPVSGGDVGAQKGTLAIMAGGSEEVFQEILPLLEILGSKVVRVGEVGMGQTTKACNQLFCALHMLACCEGIALAKKVGLDAGTMLDAVSSGASGSWALSNLAPKIVAEDMGPGFMIDLLCKDLRLVSELAEDAELSLPGIALSQQFFNQAQEEGLGRLGTQAMWRVIEKTSNCNV
ncbi:MAG: NAD(P)-dependent oxidoreductase [Planctomycetota bacterium]|jgi:3-hydroxyisobutyrate dehydrogenase